MGSERTLSLVQARDRTNDKVRSDLISTQLYGTQPEMGERRPDLGRKVRHFPVGDYVVFYRPIEGGVELLRVLHGSRDIPAAWRSILFWRGWLKKAVWLTSISPILLLKR